jgi:hypothetical protein
MAMMPPLQGGHAVQPGQPQMQCGAVQQMQFCQVPSQDAEPLMLVPPPPAAATTALAHVLAHVVCTVPRGRRRQAPQCGVQQPGGQVECGGVTASTHPPRGQMAQGQAMPQPGMPMVMPGTMHSTQLPIPMAAASAAPQPHGQQQGANGSDGSTANGGAPSATAIVPHPQAMPTMPPMGMAAPMPMAGIAGMPGMMMAGGMAGMMMPMGGMPGAGAMVPHAGPGLSGSDQAALLGTNPSEHRKVRHNLAERRRTNRINKLFNQVLTARRMPAPTHCRAAACPRCSIAAPSRARSPSL